MQSRKFAKTAELANSSSEHITLQENCRQIFIFLDFPITYINSFAVHSNNRSHAIGANSDKSKQRREIDDTDTRR